MVSPLEIVKSWTVGDLAAVVHKLGEDNARQLQRCDKVTVTFEADKKRATVVADVPTLEVWKTIKLGTGLNTGKYFCSALEQQNCRISDWAQDMMKQEAFIVASEEADIDLVVLSVAELGFKKGAYYRDICARALELGLELCPPEVGPQLRLQYPDQPRGEWLLIAMEPIRDSGGGLRVFDVKHGGDERWLRSLFGGPGGFWLGGDRFVFRSRK